MPPEITGLLSRADAQETALRISEEQLPSGMIPWFPGGHADPWNHIESAMALDVCGVTASAERAYQWLADSQRPDGAWHQYYRDDEIEQDKLDANCVAYVATGVLHHWSITGDRGFLDTMWPVVDRATEFVLGLQRPRGEIRWARHPDGTPWSFALLTSSSSISHSLRAALALADAVGADRPLWSRAGARLVDTIRSCPDAFAPKHRWAMDWYYPVLSGALRGETARERLTARHDAFVIEGRGVRCVSDRPWVTAAETAECCLAYLSLGDRESALRLFEWAQLLRDGDHRYWTGMVFPEEVHFPADEKTTYTSAAIILAADALTGTSAASNLLIDHDALPQFDPLAS